MKKTIHKYRSLWSLREFRFNVFWGLFFLIVGLLANYAANVFVSNRASNYVSDLILDHLPVFNVGFIFVEGFIFFWAIAVFFSLKHPQKIPFTLKSIAIFVVIRSIFICLTHLAIPPDHSYIDPGRFVADITSGNDLFFSFHTGLPFLLALIFWENKRLRYFFIFCSMFFGFSVLLGHLHYSIDVFAAYFITYGVFHIAQRIFPKDYKLFLDDLVA